MSAPDAVIFSTKFPIYFDMILTNFIKRSHDAIWGCFSEMVIKVSLNLIRTPICRI